MEQIAEKVNKAIEFPIDFEGQKKVNRLTCSLVYLAIPISVFAGFVTQNIINLVIAFAATILVTLVVVLPAWPLYNQNPVNWLEVKYGL